MPGTVGKLQRNENQTIFSKTTVMYVPYGEKRPFLLLGYELFLYPSPFFK